MALHKNLPLIIGISIASLLVAGIITGFIVFLVKRRNKKIKITEEIKNFVPPPPPSEEELLETIAPQYSVVGTAMLEEFKNTYGIVDPQIVTEGITTQEQNTTNTLNTDTTLATYEAQRTVAISKGADSRVAKMMFNPDKWAFGLIDHIIDSVATHYYVAPEALATKGKDFATTFVENFSNLVLQITCDSMVLSRLNAEGKVQINWNDRTQFERDIVRLVEFRQIFSTDYSPLQNDHALINAGITLGSRLSPSENQFLKMIARHNNEVTSREKEKRARKKNNPKTSSVTLKVISDEHNFMDDTDSDSSGDEPPHQPKRLTVKKKKDTLFYFDYRDEAHQALRAKIISLSFKYKSDYPAGPVANLVKDFVQIMDLEDNNAITYYNPNEKNKLRLYKDPRGITHVESIVFNDATKILTTCYEGMHLESEKHKEYSEYKWKEIAEHNPHWSPLQLRDEEFARLVNSSEWNAQAPYPDIEPYDLFSNKSKFTSELQNNAVLKFIVLCNYCCYRYIKDTKSYENTSELQASLTQGLSNLRNHIQKGESPLNFPDGYKVFVHGKVAEKINEYKAPKFAEKPYVHLSGGSFWVMPSKNQRRDKLAIEGPPSMALGDVRRLAITAGRVQDYKNPANSRKIN